MRMTPQWMTGMREILLHKTRKSSHSENPASARIVLSTARRDLQRFNVQRHLSSAQSRRVLRAAAMTTWREAVAAA
jgi:hypothetical protein